MNNFLPQTSLMVQSLGIALLHSLWQCLFIYICLQVVLALTGKQNAKLRYAFSMAALIIMTAWFADTWLEQWGTLHNTPVIMTEDAGGVLSTAVTGALAAQSPDSDILNNLIEAAQPYLPIAVAIYLAGLCLMILRFGTGIAHNRRMRNKGITKITNNWQQWLQETKEQLHINRAVQLCYSVYAHVPMTIGTLKPVILLPFAMANSMSTEQVEAILLHELAHIRRNDYLLNILQALAETLLFFNPFIWLVSSAIRKEREHCCDDLVLSCSAGPLPYARALAALEARRREANALALAATGNKNRLFNRIKRIMEMKKQKNNYARAIIASLVIAAIVVSFAWLSPSFAQSHKAKAKTSTKRNSTHTESNTSDQASAPKPSKSYDKNEDSEAPATPEAEDPDETVSKAMKDVDWDQIDREMKKADKAMAEADEGMRQADREMAAVNWDQLNKELADAQKEIDAIHWEDIQKEIDRGLKEARRSIDDPKLREKVEESLALARKQSLRAVARANRALIKAQLDAEYKGNPKSSYNAAVWAPGAGSSTNTYTYSNGNSSSYNYAYTYGKSNTNAHAGGLHEVMLRKMEHEGLIDRSRSYKVEKYSDRLYINGQLQPGDVYMRYNKYMKNENLTIKGDRDHIRISVKD